MNNPAANPALEASHWEPKFPFDLVVAYEDVQTRDRALKLYDHLAQQLLNDYDFQCSWWKFDHLESPALRARATNAAAEANMVILSLRGSNEMPLAYKAWIEDWASRRDHSKAALVALISETNSGAEPAPALAYLQQIARQGHMDFFTHGPDRPQPKLDSPAELLGKRAGVAMPVIPPQLMERRMPTPRWGINE